MPEHVSLRDLSGESRATAFDDPKTVRLQLEAGDRIPAHSHPGSKIIFHLHDGRLTIRLNEEAYVLSSGDAVRFRGEREMAIEAQDDSIALVVFVPAHATR